MQIIADVLLGFGSLGAMLYCYILTRRLKKFNQLESGMGGAIAVLSVQVDDMTKALVKAQNAAGLSSQTLEETTQRAEQSAVKLEALMTAVAAMLEQQDMARRGRSLRRRQRFDDQGGDLASYGEEAAE